MQFLNWNSFFLTIPANFMKRYHWILKSALLSVSSFKHSQKIETTWPIRTLKLFAPNCLPYNLCFNHRVQSSLWSIYVSQQGLFSMHLTKPAKRVNLLTKCPGFALITSCLCLCSVLTGLPDSTKKAPFSIKSPSDLQFHDLHSL